MRCSSLSIANGLTLSAIQTMLRKNHIPTQWYGDAIYRPFGKNKHVYYFANGTIVTWNLYRKDTEGVIHQIRKFRESAYQDTQEDHFSYSIGNTTDIKPHDYFNVELITLEEENDDYLRLAVSYALSQSIKLKSYENHIETLIKQHTHLVKHLAYKGDIKLSRKKIQKIMGKIFLAKEQINLDSEFHKPPKFFWKYSSYEVYYLQFENFMDIPKRAAGLNKKLDTLNEMFDMLNSQLQHQHSSVLEIVIIILIGVEIFFSILHFWF